jgi:DNA-binding MarR family transcriptional regulator
METMQRIVYPFDLSAQSGKLEEICGRLKLSKAEALRQALDHYYEYVKGMKIIEIREISEKQAEKEILAFLKSHKGAFTSEIADSLRLDIVLVDSILHKLAEKGRVS